MATQLTQSSTEIPIKAPGLLTSAQVKIRELLNGLMVLERTIKKQEQ